MMTIKKIFTFLLLLNILTFSQEIFKGDLFIYQLRAECIDTTLIANKMLKIYPPNFLYEKDKLVYELTITIKLYGNEYSYSKPLALTFRTPDNNISTMIINQELYDLQIDEYYEFILNLQSREKGWANVEINEWDMYNLRIVKNFNINFINYSFYLD